MSGTGSPYDVKHLTHVSQELSWHVEDLQRLDVLGEGAYAEVYHVVHSGMHFAAKILASDLCDKELQNETEILRKCQHPNIVVCFSSKYIILKLFRNSMAFLKTRTEGRFGFSWICAASVQCRVSLTENELDCLYLKYSGSCIVFLGVWSTFTRRTCKFPFGFVYSWIE